MELEDESKVVTSVWGEKFVQFLAALAVLPQSIWKNRMYSTFSFKQTRRPLPCVPILSFFLAATLAKKTQLVDLFTAHHFVSCFVHYLSHNWPT